MATLERAIEIAARAHAGAVDRQQQPYILHPVRVMMGVDDPEARIVAILHDVIEDSETTLDDIRREGFSDAVLTALELVTRNEGTSFADYVVRCKSNALATLVKLADLKDNAALHRLMLRPDRVRKDTKRIQRYVFSYQFLTDQIDEPTYRRLMKPAE